MFPKAKRTGTPSRKNRDFRKLGTNASIFFISTPLSLSFLVRNSASEQGPARCFFVCARRDQNFGCLGIANAKNVIPRHFCSQTVQKKEGILISDLEASCQIARDAVQYIDLFCALLPDPVKRNDPGRGRNMAGRIRCFPASRTEILPGEPETPPAGLGRYGFLRRFL